MGCLDRADSPVVDTSLARLVVDVKVLQVVVEIDASGTQVSSEEGSVGGEDGGDVNVSFSAQGNSKTGLPFVEVSNDRRLRLSRRELAVSWGRWKIQNEEQRTSPKNQATM